MKEVTVNRENVQLGILDYNTSTVYVRTVIIWWDEEGVCGNNNKHASIETELENMGFKLNNIEWMECSKVEVDTNKYTFNRRLENT